MIDTITDLYRLAAHPVVYRTPVPDAVVRSYAEAVSSLAEAVGPEPDEPWAGVLRAAKGARWRLLTVPLPAGHPGLALSGPSALLRKWAPAAREALDERAFAALSRAEVLLAQIIGRQETPLAVAVADELTLSSDTRLFLDSKRSAAAVGDWLATRGLHPQIAHPGESPRVQPVELACVIGAARWCPPHLVTAPRASSTAFIHHDWIREPDIVAGVFGSAGGISVRLRWIGPPPSGPDARDLEHQPEWAAIARHGREAAAAPEQAEALLVVVAGGKRVFLDTEAGSVVTVVEPGAPRDSRVRRERVRQLSAGDFILVRMHRGGDDVIRVIADRVLGANAAGLRAAQAEWKRLLADRVRARGYANALRDLAGLGVVARNLRGWLSPDSIRPERAEDFALILKYCGIGDQHAALWRQMGQLDAAHLRAGVQLRQMLEDRIESADMAALWADGFMAVTLSIPNAGSLGVFRVDAIAPDPIVVPVADLGVVEDLPEDLWQG